MKLRNEKTGDYGRLMMCHDGDRYPFYIEVTAGIRIYFNNFERMLEAGWEVYVEPKEPLIKDEKIRKAVRAWAEAGNVTQIKYSIAPNQYYDADLGTGFSIKFTTKPVEVYLEEHKAYTITELCGEEEV